MLIQKLPSPVRGYKRDCEVERWRSCPENALTGGILAGAGGFVICLNISVMYVLIRSGFLVHRRSGIYILAFANLIGDTIQQLVTVLYAAPASILQSFLIDGDRRHPFVYFWAYWFLFAWYEGLLIQGTIAIDRLLSVVFPGTARSFTLKNYTQISVLIYLISGGMAVWSQFFSPCCTAYVYYGTFGYAYLGDGFNYSDHFIDLPLNSSITILMFVCYAWIYLCVRRSNRIASVTDDELSKRRAKEVKFATQFSVIASVLAFTWITFRIFPLVIPPEIPQLYSLVPLALTFHCSTNATIFLTMNSEFSKVYKKTFTWKRDSQEKGQSRYRPSTIHTSETSNVPNVPAA
ncbi:G-PROTEIN-RECEP-F1-2 domain-containing protein [Aphelenchoides bicaudatus]|nr:G-PROTEIN-RECEP-F1-2 domain-containing protein [Aphelenchoides bicaudatus]